MRSAGCGVRGAGLASTITAAFAPSSSTLAPLPSLLLPRYSPPIHPRLSHDGIQRHIPFLRLDVVDALTLVGESDQQRALPVQAAAEEGQRPVVEAAAHADAVALSIEADQRRQYKVQRMGG